MSQDVIFSTGRQPVRPDPIEQGTKVLPNDTTTTLLMSLYMVARDAFAQTRDGTTRGQAGEDANYRLGLSQAGIRDALMNLHLEASYGRSTYGVRQHKAAGVIGRALADQVDAAVFVERARRMLGAARMLADAGYDPRDRAVG